MKEAPMQRKLAIAFLVAALLPYFAFAQAGKVRGKVTDRETGEALIGATVVVEGTTIGASTDINGEYFLLNVPPGAQSLKATYIGYAPVTISDVKISAGLTTTLDFRLPPTSVQIEPVSIVAERPLVQRNTTNTVHLVRREDIKDLPYRGLTSFFAILPGVVLQQGNLYVRGGRAGEVGYILDGANIFNPMGRYQNVGVIQEALEEFQLQSGGMTAEYGGANAGVVRTTLRTGESKLKATLDYRTDDFAKPGKQFLGTTSTGRRVGVLTIGGPVPGVEKARFFFAGQHDYSRNRQRIWIEPFKFDSLVTDALGARPAGVPLPGPVEFKKNYLPNNWSFTNTAQGTLLFDLDPIKLRFTGSYEHEKYPNGGSWPGVMRFDGSTYFRAKRNTLTTNDVIFGNLRATHVISPTTYYDIALSYQQRKSKTYDPDFVDDWKLYPDSIANEQRGYTGFVSRYQGPNSYSTIFQFRFLDPNAPNNSYYKSKQSSIGASIDFTSQVTPRWEVRVGGRLDSWVYRSFGVDNISNYLVYLYGIDGKTPRTFTSDYERRVRLIQRGGITTVGYDIDGNETDGTTFGDLTVDKPGKPLFASAYIQNKFEYNDLIVNLGVRYEYMDPKGWRVPESQYNEPPVDAALNIVDEHAWVEMEPFNLVLPRVSFSFPVTDRTVFFAQYGKFAQMPSLTQLYRSTIFLSDRINPAVRQPYTLAPGGAPAWTMRPERTTQYEIGLRQSLTANLAFTLSGFYKDLKDQLSIRRIFNEVGAPIFVALQNEDFGTTKGLELTLSLRRTKRLAAQVNFTLSDARGTGSETFSSRNAVTDEASARIPLFINPLEYNQTLRGAVLLDYRFDRGDGGPIFQGMGLNFVLSFNSGHNYTKVQEPQNLGQASPWNIGVRALADTRSRNPVEPINNSTTPAVFNVDMNLSKTFYVGQITAELYVNVLNLLNTKQVINVYPTTGTAFDDGWLKSPFAEPYKEIPNYEAFYRAINLQNRWGISTYYGDIYDAPRQIRLGLKVEY